MDTFDSLLAAYLVYLALADDIARAAFLKERVGFKATHQGKTADIFIP
jgi:hypothetical protein